MCSRRIKFTNEKSNGFSVFLCIIKAKFTTNVKAGFTRKRNNNGIGGGQCFTYTCCEIKKSGCIYNINFSVLGFSSIYSSRPPVRAAKAAMPKRNTGFR